MLTETQEERLSTIPTDKAQRLSIKRICMLESFDVLLAEEGLDPNTNQAILRRMGFNTEPTTQSIIQKHIDHVFERNLSKRADRWSKQKHALYASPKEETAVKEISFHCKSEERCKDASPIIFDLVELSHTGRFKKLLGLGRKGIRIKEEDKTLSQSCGDFLSSYVDSIEVRSFRHPGTNFVVFDKESLSPVRLIDRVGIKTHKRRRGGRSELYTRTKRVSD